MNAIGYNKSLPVTEVAALQDILVADPVLTLPHDLLVEVAAVSVNPVDTKVRCNRAPKPGMPEVLGWDAVGTVVKVGSTTEGFSVGDRVYYAGAINRPGSNSELQLVDSRIVGHAPTTLSNAHAAALPLTSITAWELLFDRLGVPQGEGAGQSLLIVGAAGGVGSILIQLARQLTQLTVVATASRAHSLTWVNDLGAHHVIDHTQTFLPQLQALGLPNVTMVASLTHTPEHFDDIIAALAPQGKLALIDDFHALDIMKLKGKSISLHWEMMFTRSLHNTPDMPEQGRILEKVAKLVDEGRIRSTMCEHFGAINATNLRRAHALLESNQARGKIVLERADSVASLTEFSQPATTNGTYSR